MNTNKKARLVEGGELLSPWPDPKLLCCAARYSPGFASFVTAKQEQKQCMVGRDNFPSHRSHGYIPEFLHFGKGRSPCFGAGSSANKKQKHLLREYGFSLHDKNPFSLGLETETHPALKTGALKMRPKKGMMRGNSFSSHCKILNAFRCSWRHTPPCTYFVWKMTIPGLLYQLHIALALPWSPSLGTLTQQCSMLRWKNK